MNISKTTVALGFFALLPWTIFLVRAFEFAQTAPGSEYTIYAYIGLMLVGVTVASILFAYAERKTVLLKVLLSVNIVYGIFGLVLACLLLTQHQLL